VKSHTFKVRGETLESLKAASRGLNVSVESLIEQSIDCFVPALFEDAILAKSVQDVASDEGYQCQIEAVRPDRKEVQS